ncbi:MAG: hypothetical protein ACYDBQ_04840 [Thermoplasmatota archaeon]
MNRPLAGLLALGMLWTLPAVHAASAPVRFGMDADSVAQQSAAGAAPDYGTLWIGPWTLSSGWGGPDAQLDTLRAQGVTPAIQFYYWGDDISQACITNGCWSTLTNSWKDQAGWQSLAQGLVDNLNAHLGGKPALVLVETEFNKAGVATYAPLDGLLADKAAFLHANYPAAQVVMPLGNWDSADWGTWSRFAAASDAIGLQGLRGSTHDSVTDTVGLYDALLAGSQTLHTLYGKPLVLQDIAVSSYPEPAWLATQASSLDRILSNLPTLKALGLTTILYRSWQDTPSMDTANYYGEAERHWGLSWATNGTGKPAAAMWVAAVQRERSSAVAAPAPAASAPPPPLVARFAPAPSANAWWVETAATGSNPIASVQAIVTGQTHPLAATAWGTWAASFNAPAGSQVVFQATDRYGQHALSSPFRWLSAPFNATFTPTASVNAWWVEASVVATAAPTAVAASVDGGPWSPLSPTSWGTWAASLPSPAGSHVRFQATDAAGDVSTSLPFVWQGSPLVVTFTPRATTNPWWIETAVTANQPLTLVQASLNGGAWTVLPKDAWGTYAQSLHAPAGSQIVFRASTGAASVTSQPYGWG